ncbi:MAG: PAS domain S-box protein [Spirochaetales bacterium]|nr:PAS domain S-box protein [Spirochaetales bacterium]
MDGFSYHEAILERINEPAFVRGKNGIILYSNQAAEELSGWCREGAGVRICCDKFGYGTGRVSTGLIEDSITDRQGRIRRMKFTISPLYGEAGLTGDVVIMEDVSDLKLLEDAHRETLDSLEQALKETALARDRLAENQKILTEAQRIGKMGSWAWDGKSEMARCSPESFRLYGLPFQPEGMGIKDFYRVIHRDDRERVENAMNRAIREGSSFNETYRILLDDGSERIHNDQAEIKLDEQGRLRQIIGIHQDITEIRRIEEALDRSEKRYQSILQTSLDGFLRSDGEGRILEVNRAYCRMLGYKEEELLNSYIHHLEAIDSQEEVKARIEVMKQRGYDQFESALRSSSGRLIDIELMIQYREEEDQFVCFAKDITEKKQVAEQLRQSQKLEALGSLAGGIAHDFNNILTPVMGMAELILEESPYREDIRDRAEHILKASKRGAELVRQILLFSRKGTGEIRPVLLQGVIEEVSQLLRAASPAGVSLFLELDDDCGPVNADPNHIHQVVMNLVTNAYHAVEERGNEVRLLLRECLFSRDNLPSSSLLPGGYAHLTVKDNGVGMACEVKDKIFDPYFTTKKPGKGTGLGLAVVYGIVKEHGGDITVESDLGRGATFHVWLPLWRKGIKQGS